MRQSRFTQEYTHPHPFQVAPVARRAPEIGRKRSHGVQRVRFVLDILPRTECGANIEPVRTSLRHRCTTG